MTSLFPLAFTAPGSLPVAAGGALPLGILVWAGAGGRPALLDLDVPHVWGHPAFQPYLSLGVLDRAAPGEHFVCGKRGSHKSPSLFLL